MNIHATCIDIHGHGVLLRGPSGSGKSDLALRLLDQGARLVADDQTLLSVEEGRLRACPPAATAGLIEVRGIGIIRQPHLTQTMIRLVIDLCPSDQIERLPQPYHVVLCDLCLPGWRLHAFEVSAPQKVRLAVQAVTGDNYSYDK